MRDCVKRERAQGTASLMNNDSIAVEGFVDKQRMTEQFWQDKNEALFADVSKILAPQLFAFFRSRGCGPSVAEAAIAEGDVRGNARVRVVLGRSSAQDPPEPVVIQIGNLKLDPERRLFWRDDEEIHLTPKEFDLLALMMKNPGSTLSHLKLLRSVWGLEYGGELEYLRTYVHTLRKKIEKVPARPEYIVNVPWVGYRFRNPEDSESLSFQTEQPAVFNSYSPTMR
jgi:DNA-binding winged helix-turn-helix (wHTH) protein